MALMRPDEANAGPSRPQTIEELFEALESPLLSYALRLVGRRDLAEDIVQEAFMKLHEHFEEVREPRRWLYRTTHNLALNQKRAADRTVALSSDEGEGSKAAELADPQPFPDEQIARWEGIGLVRLSLESLNERSRRILQLKFHENLSYKEISERTGLTVGHVGYLLHHAIRAVAEELAKSGMLP